MYANLILLVATLASVAARCDNSCSGHGTCQFDDVCKCFDNWGVGLSLDSGDCSERVCPFEIAWVDTPDEMGNNHKYAECAGKGICNRGSGQCECFTGYEGKGCQRTTCPSGCSGHGTCEYIEDITYAGEVTRTVTSEDTNALIWNDARPTWTYTGWDKTKTRGCVCDAKYDDIDCSKRMCPYGTDVLDQRLDMVSSLHHHQVQRLEFVSTSDRTLADLKGQSFAISFRSKLNETFTTTPIVFDSAQSTLMCNSMRLALLSLPNKVIDGVTCVAVDAGDEKKTQDETVDAGTGTLDTSIGFDFKFSGQSVQGPQHLMWVEAYECSNGCTPKITGLDIWSKITEPAQIKVGELTARRRLADVNQAGSDNPSDSRETVAAHYNSYECGRRGKCDYGTGLCDCFAGYMGENCNELTNLV